MLSLKRKKCEQGSFHLVMAESLLMLGSNLGDRYTFLKKGFEMLSRSEGVKISDASGIYETEPVGVTDQPSFLNAAVRVSTVLAPLDLLRKLRDIETDVGRKPRGRWREREIDADIIFYDQEVLETNDLTIPHPKAHLRRFVLQPISEITPNYLHPIFLKTVSQLLRECKDASAVVRIDRHLPMAS